MDLRYQHINVVDGVNLIWERHNEATTYTLFVTDADATAFLDPSGSPALTNVLRRLEDLPGDVVRVTRVWIAASDADVADILPEVGFLESDLVSCIVGGGRATMV